MYANTVKVPGKPAWHLHWRSMHHLIVGKIGEQHAVRFLRNQGYDILIKNYRTPLGEIDIVAKEQEVLAFIEVKTRSSRHFGLPQEAVNMRKQRQLIRVAKTFLNEQGETEFLCRFDVVSVILKPSGRTQTIELIRNAFDVSSD